MRTLPACLVTIFWGATALCAVAPKAPLATDVAAPSISPPPVLQAPATIEKSKPQYFPDGLSLIMEAPDLWAIRATMPAGQLPPRQFDHAYAKPLWITDVDTEAELRQLCGWTNRETGSTLVACSMPAKDHCTIILGPPQSERTGLTRNLALRHELGHCNGWPADHSDPKAPLVTKPTVVADVEEVEEQELPPPPRRRPPPPRYYGPAYPPPPYPPPPPFGLP